GAGAPTRAAGARGLPLRGYYQRENVAWRGLVGACEPVPRGRARSAESELAALRKQQQRLQRELARQQALVRLTQRTVGLASPPAPPARGKGDAGKGRKRRRALARALPPPPRVPRALRHPRRLPPPTTAVDAPEGQH